MHWTSAKVLMDFHRIWELQCVSLCACRQPAGVCLFPTGCEFSAVVDVIIKGVASSCLQVSMCAVRAAALLLRYHTHTHRDTHSCRFIKQYSVRKINKRFSVCHCSVQDCVCVVYTGLIISPVRFSSQTSWGWWQLWCVNAPIISQWKQEDFYCRLSHALMQPAGQKQTHNNTTPHLTV